MARYGRDDCEHQWAYRKDGWEEECAPTVCRECGAFGCLHDMKTRPPREEFFAGGLNGDANINGRWVNPYVEKEKPEKSGK